MDKLPGGDSVLSHQSVRLSVESFSTVVAEKKANYSLSDDTPQKVLGHNYLNMPRGSST